MSSVLTHRPIWISLCFLSFIVLTIDLFIILIIHNISYCYLLLVITDHVFVFHSMGFFPLLCLFLTSGLPVFVPRGHCDFLRFYRVSKHPRYNKADPYYPLTRREQVTVFRLRTGHNLLSHHLYSKLRNGHTVQCPCGTGSQTTEHLLQSCPLYEILRQGIWPDHTPVARKLY